VSAEHGHFEERLGAGLRRHVPGFRELVSCERLSGGASQETYRVVLRDDGGERPLAVRRAAGGVASVRFPGYPGLRAEASMMRYARTAGVPVPEIYWIFTPEDELGDGFAMQWLDGETLGARIVRSPELAEIRPRLAEQCGAVLARIHAIDLQASGLDQVLDRIPPAAFVEQTWQRYQAFSTPQPMIDFTARWLQEHLPGDSEMRLVHNDFRNGNLMVSRRGIVAVLDWELAHIGDPMRDLGWLCTNSWRYGGDLPVGGFGDYADLFRGYESVSGKPVDPERVKYWQVFGSFWWAVGCLEMAEHYRSGPDKSVERPAIGRRSSECQVDCVNLLIPGPVDLLPTAPPESTDMPRADELLASVAAYLRQDVMTATRGRTSFLARVAANAVDVVQRELCAGPAARQRQHAQLRTLLACDGTLAALEWKLAHALRDGAMALDTPGLAQYLRDSVVQRVAIDQPRYSGLANALANALSAQSQNDGSKA